MSDSGTSYQIISADKQSDKLNVQVSLNADHDLFKGHFPNNPIMPGVLNMEIMEHVLATELNLKVKQINQMKFLMPVVPKSNGQLSYDIDLQEKSDGRRIGSVQGITEGNVFVKIQLELEPKD